MSSKIEIKEKPQGKYMLFSVVGMLQVELTTELVLEAVRLKKETNINKALFDLRKAELKDSFIESHNFMAGLKELGVDYSDYIAVVYSLNPVQHEHAENVAYNRGFYNIKYFKEIDQAEKWLLSKK